MQIDVLNLDGEIAGQIDLSERSSALSRTRR